MAWVWSHSNEAYKSLQRQLERKVDKADSGDGYEIAWLKDVFREWSDENGCGYKLDDIFEAAELNGWRHVGDQIWQYAEEQATCETGGYRAWLCPHGCGCHLLPFEDPEANETQ